ncbi:MAG: FG-GAP repeat protein [Phycisphaerales bacterium]|nr:MAG: FG-GAP repeat protein [Phycisphaerales bacterium]
MLKKLNCRNPFDSTIVWAACLLLPCTGAAWGQWEQIHKLTAEQGAWRNGFGWCGCVSGQVIIVGAQEDDHAGTDSGSAYLFDTVTGDLIRKLIADDAATGDAFGCCVAVSEDIIVVGARFDDDAGGDSGSAYVFDAAKGEQIHKLTADDAEDFDHFGASVSVSGNTIVVGSRYDDDAGFMSGSAYVFDAVSAEQVHKLTADDAAQGDCFGWSVSVNGNTVVVGAPDDSDAGSSTGSAYVFDATTGQQLHKLTADDGAAYDSFGASVSVSGNIAVVGAACTDDAGESTGSAYIFDVTTGQQLHKLTADDGAAYDYFGNSVSISDATIVVGAIFDDDAGPGSGSVYVFDAPTGRQLCKLIAEDATAGDRFGEFVFADADSVLVGAPHDEITGSYSGSAYLFQQSSPCPADVNDDDVVNIDDLFAVLAAWGTCDNCPEDINDDGKVNIDEVFAVLGAWGPCP